jgi:hypothetical protein
MISYIFNLDIKKDIKKNILDYQRDLWNMANSEIHKQDFKYWLEKKEWLQPSLEIMLEFSNLYFNYQLNKLFNISDKILAKDYKKIQELWLENYIKKFWILNEKFKKNEKLTQEEFDLFFDSEKYF